MNWPQEDINVVYGKNGLVSFNWMAPVEIEDWQDDYAFLLPFSEISQIFEEMLEGSLTIDAGVLTGDLNISEVRLGYVRVISKDLLQEDSHRERSGGLYRRSGACLEFYRDSHGLCGGGLWRGRRDENQLHDYQCH